MILLHGRCNWGTLKQIYAGGCVLFTFPRYDADPILSADHLPKPQLILFRVISLNRVKIGGLVTQYDANKKARHWTINQVSTYVYWNCPLSVPYNAEYG